MWLKTFQPSTHLTLLADGVSEGVLMVSRKRKVLVCNHAFLQATERNESLPWPQFLSDLMDPSGSPLLQQAVTLIEKSLEGQCPLTHHFSQELHKKFFDLDTHILPHDEGVLLVVSDRSSDRKVSDVGKEFVANASHELRTPITIIKGFAETLHEMPEIDPEMQRTIVEKILNSCSRMENLIKNLLLLAEIQHLPASRFKMYSPEVLLHQVIDQLLLLHPEEKIDLQIPLALSPAFMDVELMEVAILNLLTNAVKYSVPPAHITIRAEMIKEELHISVQDRGMGISPEDQKHIFKRFYRAHKDRSRKQGGAGLGLSIVENIIQKHQGRIHVESILSQGSTFTIVIPQYRHG